MLHSREMWNIIKSHMPRGQWILLSNIYDLVERYGNLDAEDLKPQAPRHNIPKWKRNVRNVLQRKKNIEIQWDGNAKYRL